MNFENEQVEMILLDTAERTDKTCSVLASDFASVRAGRANPHILDKILVDYYGTPTPINQVGNLSVADARCLVIAPWDASMLKVIEKQLLQENIGITPSNDGKVIRLVFPQLTEERRKELVKQVKKMAEDAKVAVRNIRRDGMEALKKLKNDKAADSLYRAMGNYLKKGRTQEAAALLAQYRSRMTPAQKKSWINTYRRKSSGSTSSPPKRKRTFYPSDGQDYAAPSRHYHGREWQMGTKEREKAPVRSPQGRDERGADRGARFFTRRFGGLSLRFFL